MGELRVRSGGVLLLCFLGCATDNHASTIDPALLSPKGAAAAPSSASDADPAAAGSTETRRGSQVAVAVPFDQGMARPYPNPHNTPLRDQGFDATLVFDCVIRTDGTLEDCRPLTTDTPELAQASQDVLPTVMTWRFMPAMRSGQPLAVRYKIPIRMVHH